MCDTNQWNERLTVKTNPCFTYEGKTGEEGNLVTLKDTPKNKCINAELSTSPFHLYGR